MNSETLHGIAMHYDYNDKEYIGYLSLPQNATSNLPLVLLCPEFWGITDYIKWRADQYADLGYAALVVDFYGKGTLVHTPQEATELMNATKADMDTALGVFQAAIDALHIEDRVDNSKLAAVGYCFGGAMALSIANAGFPLRAVMAFHSIVDLPIMPSEKLTATVVVANGEDDPFAPDESVETFKNAMDDVNASYEYISYEGVKHAFTNRAATAKGVEFDMPLDYDEMADKHSWQRVQDLLEEAF